MVRSLLSCASIFVLLISTLLSPASVSASRCGVRMPVTLLSLYRNSEFIYVGTFDRVEEGEVTEETENYSVIPLKKYFSLSSSLKGETKKMLVLEESQYHFKLQPAVEEEVASEGETADAEATAETVAEPEETAAEDAEVVEADETEVVATGLNPGDRVLLFLSKNDDGELNPTDYIDGIKKMTPERLSSYEPRIRELNAIFSKAEPSYTEIVAWLVRCAEDPHTRWEGTYELLRSFQAADWRAERAKMAEQKPVSEEDSTELESIRPRTPAKFETGDENFAKALTEGEKLLLTNMLLDRERPNPTKGSITLGLNHGDRELIELVRRWGDTKVAINILELLRYDSSDSNLNADLMRSFASILNDDRLTELSEQYTAIQWRGDDEEVEEEEQESDVEESDEPASATPVSTEAVVVVVESEDAEQSESAEEISDETETPDDTASAATPANAPKKKAYSEVKADLLKRFLDRADRLIAEKEKGESK